MVRFFTWRDIEIVFEERRLTWPESWNDVKVYSDSIMIYYKLEQGNDEENRQYLKEVFTKYYNIQGNRILIDFTQEYLDVVFEEEADGAKKIPKYAPLFKDIYLGEAGMQSVPEEFSGARVLAFHSYKGGVGRTLSLISLLRECTAQYQDKKILLIDADIEAPGLTWMMEKQGKAPVSYLDILSVMNFEENTERMIEKLAELVKVSTITITTDKMEKEQFFIPVYRNKNQIMDIFSSPERILLTKDNKYYITETLSRLGEALGAELVLVDLRAGITEYSAPFLFDPRVEKYYVTSTSLQSIKGLNQILEQIYGKTKSEFLNSKVLMTMIPEAMGPERIMEIEDQVLDNIESYFDTVSATFLRENYIVPIPFDDALIYIDDFSSLCKLLQNRKITEIMSVIAEGLFVSDKVSAYEFTTDETRNILKSIHSIAEDEVTAEGNNSANILVTSSIREIVRNYKNSLPRIVVSGAKGAGKTYIYKQLLSAKTWGEFEHLIDNTVETTNDNTLILPLIASLNLNGFKTLITECIEKVNTEFENLSVKSRFVNDNFITLRDYLEENEISTRGKWVQRWIEAILFPFGMNFHRLSELDDYLEIKQKRIVFIVDGLEDLCLDAQLNKSDNWKYVIRSICQDIINELDNLDHGNIGIMVFARKDMLSEAIETNYEQFRNIYQKYELNWSQTEALRLALWLTARAYPPLAEGIDILTATREVLVEKLTRLWGLKLGKEDSKEAFSDRWIMAALSDFTGQLQARDIVRFLKYSTSSYMNLNMVYPDRLIMPLDIRNAITPCSGDKLEEIKTEMKNIYEILEKFMEMDRKTLPLTLDKIELTGEQISRLETQGLLKIADKKYYLPEIIRLALGFQYDRGARPKVLSLLVK